MPDRPASTATRFRPAADPGLPAAAGRVAPAEADRVPAAGIAAFLAIVLGGATALPLGIAALLGPDAVPLAVIPGMLMPALAALAVELLLRRRRPGLRRTPLGAVFAVAGVGARPGLGLLAALAAMLVLAIGQPVLAAALGLVAFRAPAAPEALLLATALQFAAMLVGSAGEELGWRGWLQTRLAPLGLPATIAATAAVWVAFHVPLLVATGGGSPAEWAAALGTVAAAAVVLGLLRDRFASVWPAVLAHALMNSLVLAVHGNLVDAPSGELGILAGAALSWSILLGTAVVLRSLPRRADDGAQAQGALEFGDRHPAAPTAAG